jgi:hypothetical protein
MINYERCDGSGILPSMQETTTVLDFWLQTLIDNVTNGRQRSIFEEKKNVKDVGNKNRLHNFVSKPCLVTYI